MSQIKSDTILSRLSPHLFWDTDRSGIDLERNKQWLIHRVLEFGLLSDWKLIKEYYGLTEIALVAKQIRDLDPKALSFIAVMAKIPKEDFLCYTSRQSMPKYWNF